MCPSPSDVICKQNGLANFFLSSEKDALSVGVCVGGGSMEDWEVSVIMVNYVKLPNNQQKYYVEL